jgi:hypothetical protein
MAWPADYKIDPSWFNPWPIKYLLPAVKWFPLYWPHEEWEVISFPPAFDSNGNRLAPKPPDGATGPWWKMLPKSEWPIAAPWEPKWFGAWPASKVMMSEDLKPSIWPGGHRAPPWGFIKLAMPGEPAKKGNQITFTNWRIHMRPYLGPIHHMKIMTRQTPMGQRFYMIDKNWNKYEYEAQQYRAALKARKQEQFMQTLADEILRTNSERKPRGDLFA